MTKLDLRLLRALEAVAEAKSFGRAAEALHTTQPGVSQQIARLERHFGVRLLTRGKGSVEPTVAGAQILSRARDILAAVTRLDSEAQAWAAGHAGAVALGLSSSVLAGSIPPRIREFRNAHPQYMLTAEVASADLLIDRLDAGGLDAVLTTLPPRGSDYVDIIVGEQRLGVAVPVGHPAAERQTIGLADLIADRFIVIPRARHAEVYDFLITGFTLLGSTLDIAVEEVAFPNVLARVGMGEGVGLVPVELATTAATGVVVIPLDGGPALPVRYVSRRGTSNHAAGALLEHLRTSTVRTDHP